jgi:transposase InsO family protein
MTMAEEVAAAIVALRRQRPYWGPKKLRAVLQRDDPKQLGPAPSTIGDLLRREGLSAPRRRRRRAVPLTQPFLPVHEPNDLWCIDFKGWFRTADGQHCDPLTITDADSRFLIECRIVPETIEAVRPVVDQAFRELGLPRAIRSDNGAPFASGTSPGGLSRLSVHWVKPRHSFGADRAGRAAAEWPSRAHARHAQGGDLAPPGRDGRRATGAV